MWLITLTRHSRSQSRRGSRGPPGGPVIPALEKNASIGPDLLRARDQLLRISCSRPTSAVRRGRRPARRCAPSRSRSETTTARAPSSAKRSERAADAARRARDHDVPARQLHGAGPYSRRHGDRGDPPRAAAGGRARRRGLRARRGRSRPAEGKLLVRNRFMSVDPYMRGRMNDRKSYVPPFELGKAMYGGAVGEASRTGRSCCTVAGWREEALVPGARYAIEVPRASRPAPSSARSGCPA